MSLKELLLAGKSKVDTFFSHFLNREIKVRPLTVSEMDDAMYEASLGLENMQAVDLIARAILNVSGIDPFTKITPEMYAEMLKFRTNVDNYICYHAMKDFDDITVADIRGSGLETHDLSRFVMRMSVASPEKITAFIKTPQGQNLLTMHFYLNTPLVDEA